jgi:hypothetical protein
MQTRFDYLGYPHPNYQIRLLNCVQTRTSHHRHHHINDAINDVITRCCADAEQARQPLTLRRFNSSERPLSMILQPENVFLNIRDTHPTIKCSDPDALSIPVLLPVQTQNKRGNR